MVAVMFTFTIDTTPAVAAVGGPVFLSGDDADDGGHCSGATSCGGLYANLIDFAVQNSTAPGGAGDILAIGVNGQALTALNNWNGAASNGPYSIVHLSTAGQIGAVNFANYKLLYIPSDGNTSGGISAAQLAALNLRQAAIQNFVNVSGGGLISLTEGGSGAAAYGWLPIPITTSNAGHGSGSPITPTADLISVSPSTTSANLTHCCLHNTFTGPAGFSGLNVLAFHNHGGTSAYEHGTDEAVILGGAQVTIVGNLSLSPINDTNDLGDSHTVTATALDGNPAVPSVGTLVTFSIVGPNAAAVGTCSVNADCTTDGNGQVSFTYSGAALGSDVITATFVDAAQNTQTAIAGKDWIPARVDCLTKVTWDAIPGSYVTDTTPVPFGPSGTFTFEAKMTNTGTDDLSDLLSPVVTLSPDNRILNYPESPATVGAVLTLPTIDGYADGVLSTGEMATFKFVVGLDPKAPFTFFVDLTCRPTPAGP